ncbi:MAG: holo-[acyl-carrier-protein] synthase [Candidatus Marinimicrobia bacterium]|nr:holo-[acyl-carrier-protein] synthase [Candidatus Neomarinimicrobiota bacterium]|tara:strand:+ start:3570 stop:3923 length:354 start_codon:yes stop_codon:yes gene_type:complete
MILVGNDIVEIDKIRKLILRYNSKFLIKIFSKNELDFCRRRLNPEIHLAGRFAGKEAVKKILLQLKEKPIPLKNIEINRKINGPPRVYLDQELQNNIQLSISHTNYYATAVAILNII